MKYTSVIRWPRIIVRLLAGVTLFISCFQASEAVAERAGVSKFELVGMDYRTGSRVWRKQTYDTVYLTFGTLSGQRADQTDQGVDLNGDFLISAKSFPGAAYNCTMFNGSAIVYSSKGSFSKSYTCPHDKDPTNISYVSTNSTLKRDGKTWRFNGTATIKGTWLGEKYDYVITETIELVYDNDRCRLINYRRIDKHDDTPSVTKSVKTVCIVY